MSMITSKYFSFFNNKHLKVESRIWQGIFLYVIPVRIIVPWLYLLLYLQFNLTSWLLLKKTVGHINCNRNTIKDIPHVGLCLFTDV